VRPKTKLPHSATREPHDFGKHKLRVISLSCQDGCIIGSSLGGEALFRIAMPSEHHAEMLRVQVAEALSTEAPQLDLYEQGADGCRCLGRLDIIRDFSVITVKQVLDAETAAAMQGSDPALTHGMQVASVIPASVRHVAPTPVVMFTSANALSDLEEGRFSTDTTTITMGDEDVNESKTTGSDPKHVDASVAAAIIPPSDLTLEESASTEQLIALIEFLQSSRAGFGCVFVASPNLSTKAVLWPLVDILLEFPLGFPLGFQLSLEVPLGFPGDSTRQFPLEDSPFTILFDEAAKGRP
jgi:hypothetical protein